MSANRSRPPFFIPCILSVALLLMGCGETAIPPQGPPEVGVHTAATQPVAMTTVLPGRTSAYAIAEVRPQVGGIVRKRTFTEGSEVKAGQPLYQIDPSTFQTAYQSAKAALAKAEADAVTARLKAARYKNLVAAEAVSKQDYDDAVATMKHSAAEVLAAKAALEAAQINLLYTQVNSPISGRIGRALVTQGALVTAAQASPLAVVQQLDPIYVDVKQSSAEYLRLRQALASGHLRQAGAGAAKVKLTMEDGTDYPLEGKLQLLDINVDLSTSAVTLRAVFPNPDGLLLPGVFVRAKVEEGVSNQAILLPQQGVMRNHKGDAYALVVGKDNKVESRNLTVGQAAGNQWWVLGGIQPGDKVIVDGLQKVQIGQAVKMVEVKTADTSGLRDSKVAPPADSARKQVNIAAPASAISQQTKPVAVIGRAASDAQVKK